MKGVALVTGSGRGLGRVLATFLAGQGCDIVLTARTGHELQEVERSLESTGVKVVSLAGDITDPRHRTRLLNETDALGGLSLLANTRRTSARPRFPNSPAPPSTVFAVP